MSENYGGEHPGLEDKPPVLTLDEAGVERLAKAILRARFGAVWNLVEDQQNAHLIGEHREEADKEARAIVKELRSE